MRKDTSGKNKKGKKKKSIDADALDADEPVHCNDELTVLKLEHILVTMAITVNDRTDKVFSL